MRNKTMALAALAITGTLTLAACGSSSNSMKGMPGMGSATTMSPTSPGAAAMAKFNGADVTFATDMIPHHRQAVEMAQLAGTRSKNPQVKKLALQIMNAQDPEIQTMSGWLTTWGNPIPENMTGMDMSGSMPGMMSSQDMDKLKNSLGVEFDRMFLTMMIAHHEGAITMAKSEQAGGMNTDAIALAKRIEKAQTEEIATMEGLLK